MVRTLRQLGLAFLIQFGVTILALYLFLAVPPLFGCLGYSDRPGAGCYGGAFNISLQQFVQHSNAMLGYAGFGAMFLWPPAVLCSLIAVATRKWPRFRSIRALVLGTVGFVSTSYLTAGVGWYFALSAVGVLIIALVGAGMAACVVPRLLASNKGAV